MTTPRRYFYDVDRHGVLWHDGTALVDERFLRGFFARLRPDAEGARRGYPFVSPCAGELNYVRAEVTPIVFRRLADGDVLEASGGVRVALDPATLRVDAGGRLFHAAPVGDLGLLDTRAAMALADRIVERAGRYAFRAGTGLVPITPAPE